MDTAINSANRGTHTSTFGVCTALAKALQKCIDQPDVFHEAVNFRLPDNLDPQVLCKPLLKALERRECKEQLIEARNYFK
mmetsp:Transcript_3554/g.10717  ORF Transcript_3554/g.10717 Transcript_3554/m.10717 type:complete len:80 (+) Transcript_3554:123-362(+)